MPHGIVVKLGKADVVLVTIRERLELVQPPYNAGPFLYFSPTNAESRAFMLRSAPASASK